MSVLDAAVSPLFSAPGSAPVPVCDPELESFSDAEWVRRIRSGDVAAYETLFRAVAPGLSAFLSRYIGSVAGADDLIQDLFLAVWTRRATLEVRGSLRTYLFIAARNRALNYLKHERVEDRFRAALLERSDALDASAPSESEFLTALELQRAIDALPPRCRLIFTLSRQDDLSYGQIAARLGISVKTVEVQMGRALKRLRTHRRELLA